MKLSLGPVLFYWDRQQTLDFYANMAEQPLDVIYLGETVCSKRRAMMLDDWLGLARDLAEASSAQLVLSGLTLVEAASELSSLRRLCDNGELLVEANDMGAVQLLAERGLPFVGRAGRLLDLMFGAIGMSRAAPDPAKALYITNILPWRPPQNRDPSPEEIARRPRPSSTKSTARPMMMAR